MKILLTLFMSLSLTQLGFSVQVGKKAPDFKLPAHDGKTYDLAQFKGKHVVLEWYNNDCPYVKKHYGVNNMQNLQSEFTKKDVVWLSIISSAKGKQGHVDQAEAKKLIDSRKSHQTAILLDPSGAVGKLYEAKTTPHMFILNPKGELVYQGAIDDQASADPATVKTAKPYFKNALTASLAGKAIKQSSTKPYGCSVKYSSK